MKRVVPELKLDADDQEKEFEKQAQKIKDAIAGLEQKRVKKNLIWPTSASVIANDIASEFFRVTSLFHADLRRMIIEALEEDRKIAAEQFDE